MNVKGFTDENNCAELQSITQNDSLVAISRRYQQAVAKSPSEETELELKRIISEVSNKKDGEYEKMLLFQCRRELAKSLMKRLHYSEAIQYIIECLRFDETRANLWSDLAICARQVEKTDLYRAATAKVKAIRPEFNLIQEAQQYPPFTGRTVPPQFICFCLPNLCFRTFFIALEKANQNYSSSIFSITVKEGTLQINHTRRYATQEHPKTITITEDPGKPILKLGNRSLIDLFLSLQAEQITNNSFMFDRSSHYFTADVLNTIAEYKYKDPIPAELAKDIISIAQRYVFEELKPTTKLFVAELASAHSPQAIKIFIKDIMQPFLHMPDAILRICALTLEDDIRENKKFSELQRLLAACRKHLTKPLIIQHTGKNINEQYLKEKEDQINILRTIDDENAPRTPELAQKYFSQNQCLKFLSLKNAVRLFLQFPDDMVKDVVYNFLHMLPALVKTSIKDAGILINLFARFTYPMSDECVKELTRLYSTLSDINADKNLKFACALAQAYASKNYKDRYKLLVDLHKKLGEANTKACHFQGGKFLEILLDCLFSTPEAQESDITKAFNCYYSDVALTATTHDSQLKMRCGPYLQKFYEHVKKLEDKQVEKTNNFFTPYLELWLHYTSERDKPPEEQCLHDIDGWRVYKAVKRKEKDITKTQHLPKGTTPTMLFEDMLKNDPLHRPESRIALAKVLIRQYLTLKSTSDFTKLAETNSTYDATNEEDEKAQQEQERQKELALMTARRKKLEEAINVLEGSQEPTEWQKLLHAIVLKFLDEDPVKALREILPLHQFSDKPKKEALRLYWTMRLFNEIKETNPAAVTPDMTARAKEAAEAAKSPETLFPRSSGPEYCVLLLTTAGQVLNNPELFKEAIDGYCKSRIVLPHPFLQLAKSIVSTDVNEAYKVILKITRVKSTNITNFFHFDFKVPFLMSTPDDLEFIRRDLLQIYVDTSAKTGNYLNMFPLINPNCKLDRKLSRVFKENRFVFGIDRCHIFAKYVKELAVVYETSKKKEITERAIDAAIKGILILDMRVTGKNEPALDEQTSNEVNAALNVLKDKMWVKELHTEAPEGSTIRDLINALNETDEEEEDDDEEEDEEFVASDIEVEEEDGDEGAPNEEEDEEGEEEEIVEEEGEEDAPEIEEDVSDE